MEINGGNVVYEILGKSGDFLALTPGGRYSKDIEGLRPLAEELVKGGYRVLLWDRPNCGRSDVQFYGQSESHMRAETLHALITGLGIAPCIIAGGSGGARDSMLTTMLYPEIVTKLVVWNIVGGVYGSFVLGGHYITPSIMAVRGLGIEGLLRVGEWKERIAENPANRDRILALDADEFLKVMLRWLNAFVSKPGQTIPGVPDEMFDNITVPTLIIRGGENDWDHPKRTSLEVSCLIKGSTLIDPPWPEDAWERAGEDRASGKVKHFNMFDTWVQAAPRDPEVPGRLGYVVRMCTSQLSDASSAVWTRLSGMRSRSALRRVTWITSRPSSPGTRSMSPVRPKPASTPWASSSVPLLRYVSTPGSGSVPKALAHRATALAFSSSGSSPAISISTSRRPAGIAREIVFEHVDTGRGGEIAEADHAVG